MARPDTETPATEPVQLTAALLAAIAGLDDSTGQWEGSLTCHRGAEEITIRLHSTASGEVMVTETVKRTFHGPHTGRY